MVRVEPGTLQLYNTHLNHKATRMVSAISSKGKTTGWQGDLFRGNEKPKSGINMVVCSLIKALSHPYPHESVAMHDWAYEN